MEEKIKLLNCPFCGCEPTLERFDDNVFTVRCTHHYCWSEPDENGARTAADITIYADVEGKYNYETKDWEYTEEEINNCKKAAIEAWNNRAEDIDATAKEHTCRPITKPNVWGFCDFYCECGNKLLEAVNGIDEYLPNYCSNCGAKVI